MIRKAFLNLISDIYSIAEETSSIENVLLNLRLKGIGKNNIRERKKIARLGFLFLWSTKILMLPILIVTYFKSFILSLFVSLIPYVVFNILSFSNFLLLILLIWAACNYKSVSILVGLFFFDLLEFISGGKLFDKFMFFYSDLPVEKKRNFINKGNYFFITHLYSIKQVWGLPREVRWEDYFSSISIKCADDPELLELETNKYWSEYSKPNNLFSHRNPPSLDRPDLWRDEDAWKIMTPAALKIILKNNENINEYDNASFLRRTMLCIAVENNTSLELVKMLIDAGADVHWPQLGYRNEFSILEHAVSYSSAEIVKYLISCGADINLAARDGDCPSGYSGPHNFFQIAVLTAKEPQILREILINPNQDFVIDNYGNTLLHYAAVSPNNRSEYVKVLLDLGFDINAKNSAGQTPLIYGLSETVDYRIEGGSANLNTMKCLLSSGANPNAYDQYGNTALHCISNSHYILDSQNERVSELLLSGADIDALNLDGYTPLICAAFEGNHEAAENLINHGANIEFALETGLTAFEAACLSIIELEYTSYTIPSYVQMIDLFLESGVNVNQTFPQTSKKPIDLISERLSGMKDFSIEDLPKESMLARHLRDN